MHPRLTIFSSITRRTATLEHDLELLATGGAVRVGLSRGKLTAGGLDAGLAAVARSGLVVTHIGHGPLIPIGNSDLLGEARDALRGSVDIARAVGAPCVYGPAGGAPGLDWDAAAAAFAAGIEPVTEYATSGGIHLLIEPTISLFADISMLQTLHDTLDLAERTGVGVCIDVQHCWTERRLHDSIRRAGERTGLVQLSDWIPGTRHHFRAVPGDGVIPLERIIVWVLEAGYRGFFDLEIYPEPDVPETQTIARAIDRAGALLARAGA